MPANDEFTGSNGDPIDSGIWTETGSAASITIRIEDNRYFCHQTVEADSLWYNGAEGHGIWQLVDAPFDFIAYNIGVGTSDNPLTTWDSQAPLVPNVSPWGASPYTFCGINIHIADVGSSPEDALDGTDVNYIQYVVGNRGGTYYTIEAKNTSGGSSNAVDEGYDALGGATRADLRVQVTDAGGGDLNVAFYWRAATTGAAQVPGDISGWTLSSHTTFQVPTYTGTRAWVGIVTYLFDDFQSVPTLGTCDKVEFVGQDQEITGTAFDSTATFPTGTVSPGAVSIVGTAFDASATFPAGTVSSGNVDIVGTAFDAGATFLAGEVAPGVVELGGSTFDASATFPGGALSAGTTELVGAAFDAGATFPSGTMAPGLVEIVGSAFDAGATFPAGTVGAGSDILGTAFDASATFPAGEIVAYLEGTAFDARATFPAGVVSPGLAQIVGAAFDAGATFPGGFVGNPDSTTGVARNLSGVGATEPRNLSGVGTTEARNLSASTQDTNNSGAS